MDCGDAWLAFTWVEEQLVVVAAALAARGFGAQGQAVVAAQLHAGVVPAEAAARVGRWVAGAGGEGQGEGQQGEGLGLGHGVGPVSNLAQRQKVAGLVGSARLAF